MSPSAFPVSQLAALRKAEQLKSGPMKVTVTTEK